LATPGAAVQASLCQFISHKIAEGPLTDVKKGVSAFLGLVGQFFEAVEVEDVHGLA
jgi:hypothetical protein